MFIKRILLCNGFCINFYLEFKVIVIFVVKFVIFMLSFVIILFMFMEMFGGFIIFWFIYVFIINKVLFIYSVFFKCIKEDKKGLY